MSETEFAILICSALLIGIVIGWTVKDLLSLKKNQNLINRINAEKEYSKFLINYIDRKESFLRVHNMGCSLDESLYGENLRKIIQKLEKTK